MSDISTGDSQVPNDPEEPDTVFVGELKALTELVCDRLASRDDDEHPYFNVVPMRISEHVALITLVLSGPVTHLTDEGSTELPPGSAITLVVQEYIVGNAATWQNPDAVKEDARALWDLKWLFKDPSEGEH